MVISVPALAFAAFLLIGACQSTSSREGGDMIDTTGTITYVDLEGGFFGIVGDDGQRYNPLELEAAYREDGLRVKFMARVRKDVMTIQMWGQPVEVLRIESL